MSKERIQWIDNEKGFILLGVCIGHIGFSWNIFPNLFTFHMAAFFFLSGMLFRPDRKWDDFFRAKCRNLLLPYFVLSLFFLFLSPSLYQEGTHFAGSSLQNQLAGLITDNHYYVSLLVQIQVYILDIINGHSVPYVGPLWFVYTLFQLNVLWYLPVRLLSRLKHSSYYLGIVAIICFVGGWELYMENIILPFKLSTLTTASAFFIAGFIFRELIPLVSKLRIWHIVLCILPLIVCYSLGVVNLQTPSILYILNELDQNILAYIAVSWGGTFLLTLLFILFNNLNLHTFIGVILQLISLNGIAILALHNYIICCMKWGREYFGIPILTNNWLMLIVIIISCTITLPIINKYFYYIVGKKKPQSI